MTRRKSNPMIRTVAPYGGWNAYNATVNQLRVAGNPQRRRRRRRTNPLIQYKMPTFKQAGQLLGGSVIGYGASVGVGAVNTAIVMATNPTTEKELKYRAAVGAVSLGLVALGGISALKQTNVICPYTAGAAGGNLGYGLWQALAAQFIGYKEALQPFPGAFDHILPFDGDDSQPARTTRSATERMFDPMGIL